MLSVVCELLRGTRLLFHLLPCCWCADADHWQEDALYSLVPPALACLSSASGVRKKRAFIPSRVVDQYAQRSKCSRICLPSSAVQQCWPTQEKCMGRSTMGTQVLTHIRTMPGALATVDLSVTTMTMGGLTANLFKARPLPSLLGRARLIRGARVESLTRWQYRV